MSSIDRLIEKAGPLNHPNFVSATSRDSDSFVFRPFTGREPEPKVPSGRDFRALPHDVQQFLADQYREARTEWAAAASLNRTTRQT